MSLITHSSVRMQYHEAARVITAAGEKKAAVKSLVLSSSFNVRLRSVSDLKKLKL